MGKVFNRHHFENFWEAVLKVEMGVLWKFEIDGRTEGMIGGMVIPDVFDGELTAVKSFWYVTPSARSTNAGLQLAAEFDSWAKGRGVSRIQVTVANGNAGLMKIYDRMGYKPKETLLVKEV
jgi:RimJ/RimL family protein N-acetyltransferase